MREAENRETVDVPADWRRSAWGLFLALLGASFIAAGAGAVGLTSPVVYAAGGGLLVGLGVGLTDHVVEREQSRRIAQLRERFSSDDSRA